MADINYIKEITVGGKVYPLAATYTASGKPIDGSIGEVLGNLLNFKYGYLYVLSQLYYDRITDSKSIEVPPSVSMTDAEYHRYRATQFYTLGLWSKAYLKDVLDMGWISQSDYDEIIKKKVTAVNIM